MRLRSKSVKMLFVTILVLGLCLILCIHKTVVFPKPQIEALSEVEAVISCDTGSYGSCLRMAYDPLLGGLLMYYYCEWTGSQEDYCPFTVYLLNQ